MIAPTRTRPSEDRWRDEPLEGLREPFVVELDRFHGPLDLLLHLIRSQDIEIFDIPIAHITRQFQEALDQGLDRLELDRAGEFVEMASTLIRIKSRMLLPRNRDVEWDQDPRSDLVRRLLEYEHFQEVAEVLSRAEADRSRHFPKGYVPPRPEPSRRPEELEAGPEDFLDAALSVPEIEPEPAHEAPAREVTVREKIGEVRDLLVRTARFVYRRLFEGEEGARMHAVTALLACLEMARQQVIRIRQAEAFGEVWIKRGPEYGPGTADPEDDGSGIASDADVGEGTGR